MDWSRGRRQSVDLVHKVTKKHHSLFHLMTSSIQEQRETNRVCGLFVVEICTKFMWDENMKPCISSFCCVFLKIFLF